MAGYSNRPLAEKLGIKVGGTILILNAPPGYDQALTPLPEDVSRVQIASKRRFGVYSVLHKREERSAERISASKKASPAKGNSVDLLAERRF